MKRQLQYSQSKKQNNHAIFRSLTPRSRAHFTSSLLSLLIFFYSARITSYYVLLATLARSPASRLCFCFSAWAFLSCLCISGLHVYITCMLCISYLLRTCFPTVLVHFSSRASWLHALTSYYTLHYCSVPVQRTSRQSSLCRGLATSAQHPLPVMLAMHMLYKLSYRIREWISDELRSHRGHREQHLCSVFVEDMRRGEEGFKNVACVGRGKKPSHVKVL